MGELYAIGIGPGAEEEMTARAAETLRRVQVIAGYQGYIDRIRPLYPGKEYIATPMRGEAERCRLLIAEALKGKRCAMVCSGDAGVYGMAGLLCAMAEGTGLDVGAIPGVTAALSGAALLGAPLGHDFAVISLSDLLTPWATIEKRLECAAAGDFCIALYNPASMKRRDHLCRACDIVLRFASPDTVCGVARNIARPGEKTELMTLGELREYQADMFTTVFIGNSQTRVIDGKMVTPRGYMSDGSREDVTEGTATMEAADARRGSCDAE